MRRFSLRRWWLSIRTSRRLHTALPFLVAAVALGIVLAEGVAFARPGGGHSYSGGGGGGGGGGSWGGGGGGSSSGGGGGGGELIFQLLFVLIRLCFEVPAIGIPLLLGLIAFAIYIAVKSQADNIQSDWSTNASYGTTDSSTDVPSPASAPRVRYREQLDRIRTFDPDFSPVLFEDFVYTLFAAAHEARGAHKLETLSAYVQPGARAALANLKETVTDVKGIVIGAMRITNIAGLGPTDRRVTVRIEFECNYTETSNGKDRAIYSVEAWRFERDRNAKSKPPERARTLSCPNCGGGLETQIGATCSYCHKTVDTGEFDWVVAAVTLEQRQERGPQLTGTVPERGTDLPTVGDPRAPTRWAELQQRDPALEWNAMRARVERIFSELQTAWSTQQWERARAFVSDNLFQQYSYWMQMYAAQGLRNVTENARITKMEIARVTADKYFDAITIRIWATGLDYTLSENGSVLGGDKKRERPYSEYWTFIRGSGRKGPAGSEPKCPNCGAELKISMAGHCEYCRAKVTTGEFDWVLSRVEQDESYTG